MAISKIDSDGITAGGITADSLDIGQIGGRKNIVYNGAMTVWQRGTSADTATSGDYMCDRWGVYHAGLDGNVDWDQETSSTPDGFGYALKISTDASETSLDAADEITIQQRFEGQDLQQLQKGTSGAKSLTLSFWVKSSVASTYTAELFDNDNTRAISKSYAINTADTWEFKTITFEGDTTGAFDNDNLSSLHLLFWIDAGSNFTSGTFSTAWQANSNTERVYDTTGWLESASPEFYITGVQLEVGSVATPFEHRSYGEELALCQRYAYCINQHTASYDYPMFNANSYNTTQANMIIEFPVTMRDTPSLSAANVSGCYRYYRESTNDPFDALQPDAISNFACDIANNGGLSQTAGSAGRFQIRTPDGAFIHFEAEL